MTKAERIFRDSYAEARVHIKNWGYEENTCINHLSCRDDEIVCTRTINAIKKLIEAEKRNIQLSYKYGVIAMEQANVKAQALRMVELTIDREVII